MIVSVITGIFVLCLIIQLYYYLFFFSRLGFRNGKITSPSKSLPGVSIIICAQNEYENLQQLLPALYKQNYPQFEIIVVNDKSTDETLAYLSKEKEARKNMKVINIDKTPDHINSKKYGLSLGIKLASYDVLLLTDADCIPDSEEWISVMSQEFTNSSTKIALGFSQYTSTKGLLNLFIRFETLYTAIQYLSLALSGRPYMGVGRNLAYTKSFFIEKKGFKDHLKVTGGDDDLFINKNATKANIKVVTSPESIIYSVPKKTWKEYFRQKKRHLSVGKHYRLKDRVRLSILFLSQFFFWVTFISLLILWQEPYLVVGGFVLRMAVQYLIFYKASIKLGDKIELWVLPLLDVLYVMYYIATGISALASRNIKWN